MAQRGSTPSSPKKALPSITIPASPITKSGPTIFNINTTTVSAASFPLSTAKQSITESLSHLLEHAHKVQSHVQNELLNIQQAAILAQQKNESTKQETTKLLIQCRDAEALAKKRLDQFTKSQSNLDIANASIKTLQNDLQKDHSSLKIEQEAHAATMEKAKVLKKESAAEIIKLKQELSKSTDGVAVKYTDELKELRSKHLRELKELVAANRDILTQEKDQSSAQIKHLEQQVTELTQKFEATNASGESVKELKAKLSTAEGALSKSQAQTGAAILQMEIKIEELAKTVAKLRAEKLSLENAAEETEKKRKLSADELSRDMKEQAEEFMALLSRVTELEAELRRPKTAKLKKPDLSSNMSGDEARMQVLVKQNRHEKKRLMQRGVGTPR